MGRFLRPRLRWALPRDGPVPGGESLLVPRLLRPREPISGGWHVRPNPPPAELLGLVSGTAGSPNGIPGPSLASPGAGLSPAILRPDPPPPGTPFGLVRPDPPPSELVGLLPWTAGLPNGIPRPSERSQAWDCPRHPPPGSSAGRYSLFLGRRILRSNPPPSPDSSESPTMAWAPSWEPFCPFGVVGAEDSSARSSVEAPLCPPSPVPWHGFTADTAVSADPAPAVGDAAVGAAICGCLWFPRSRVDFR